MKNSNESERSKGVLLFAFDTQTVDYVTIAKNSAKLIKRHLGLPITLITDHPVDESHLFDKVICTENEHKNVRFDSTGTQTEWRNMGRCAAYALSPYDVTLLLDVDYLVLSDSLLKLLDQEADYALMHDSHLPSKPCYQMMGSLGLPFVWATVVVFKKSKLAKQFFDLAARVQRNYSYYKTLFNCSGTFRNDYVFAMANIILNGYAIDRHKSIPWSMLTIEDKIERFDTKGRFLIVRYPDRAEAIAWQDIHIMDKQFLMSKDFNKFVESRCNE